MPAQETSPRVARFGIFELDIQQAELRKQGVKVKLQDQPLKILQLLLAHPGQIVSREELRKHIWSSNTFVEFDHGLYSAMARLRDVLSDNADSPRFIETVARRGYRFIASVSLAPATVDASGRAPQGESSEETQTPSIFRRSFASLLGGLMGGALLLSVVVGFNFAGVRSWLRSRTAPIRSIAVLPLENLSHDQEQEYFSDGMTEALITQLSKIGTLRVTSRTSVMRYKNTRKSLPEIARELNVDGIIEGSVMHSGNRVRIVAQLIEANTDQHLWAEAYDRDLGDVLRMQSEVAQAVTERVQMHLTPAQKARLQSAPAVDPRAYEAYLRGRSFYRSAGTEATIKQGQAYFQEAVQRDPGFALAYVGLADCYMDLGTYRWVDPHDAYQQGAEAIRKALQLDQRLGEAHSSLGYFNWNYAWDWPAAEKEFRKAVELNPNYVEGHETLVWYLAWNWRRDESKAELETIRHLDPAFPLFSIAEAGIYYHLRDYKSLVEAGRRSVAANPNLWTSHYFLAVGFEGTGQFSQAVIEYQRAVDLSQGDQDASAGLAHAYAAMGKRGEAATILRELQHPSRVKYTSPYMIAAIYSGLDKKDKAFEYLDRAYQERSPDLAYFLKSDLRMNALRRDPRFGDLLHKVGLSR